MCVGESNRQFNPRDQFQGNLNQKTIKLIQENTIKTSSTMMTSSNGIIFRVTGHLCGEFTGSHRAGQSREIYSNSVPLSPPHWPYPKRIRPPSWPRVAVASSTQNTKMFTWRTWPGAGAVPKCDWAARCQCGSKQRRADHTKYIWYVATHGQSVITTELMIA